MIQKIIVPIDFSEDSERAARYAATLARRLDASLHLIHVLVEMPVSPGPLEYYTGESPEVREERYQRALSTITELAGSIAADPTRCTTEVRSGRTAESIANAVVDYGADLVIMSTHGRTGLSHLLMGSVAERVIQTARCPVLAIRGCGRVEMHRPQVEAASLT
jgi:nucleotide-binding universal stress UspA family protein